MDAIRLVIVALGIICCLSVGGIILLQALGYEASPALTGIASSATGALVGIIAGPPSRDHGKDQHSS